MALPLSRRQVLLALGAVGACSAGVGLGSAGYIGDREHFPNVTTAGTLDLKLGYRSTYNGEVLDAVPVGSGPVADCESAGLVDGSGVPVVDLADVKPGDFGTITATLYVCANPSRLWLAVDLLDAAENERRSEEVAAGDDTTDAGELQDLVEVTVWIDGDGDGTVEDGDRVVYEGTLAGLTTAAEGSGGGGGGRLLLTHDDDGPTCVEEALTVTVDWCLPLDGPDHNRATTDSVAFDCRFAAVQCRHDPDGSTPFDGTATPVQTDGETAASSSDSGG
jgi:hypothetical protein